MSQSSCKFIEESEKRIGSDPEDPLIDIEYWIEKHKKENAYLNAERDSWKDQLHRETSLEMQWKVKIAEAVLKAADFQGHKINLFDGIEENCGTVYVSDKNIVRLYISVGECEKEKGDEK